MKTNNWQIEQIITRCKNGDWHIVNGDTFEFFGELDLHCITFVSHRLATRRDFTINQLPAQIAYFPPWDNTYYITN